MFGLWAGLSQLLALVMRLFPESEDLHSTNDVADRKFRASTHTDKRLRQHNYYSNHAKWCDAALVWLASFSDGLHVHAK